MNTLPDSECRPASTCGRWLTRTASLFVLGIGLASAQTQSELPPLTSPASNVHLPGKFVWADLFTNEFDEAREFYQALFSLEWQQISDSATPYGIFLHDGRPVAGLALQSSPDVSGDYGRWVHYLSVEDVDLALEQINDRGGQTILSARSYAERGRFAIAAGPEGELVGLIRSASGDPEDYRVEVDEWFWRELFSTDAAAAGETYAELCDCELIEREDNPGSLMIASQDYLRAGIDQLPAGNGDGPMWLGFVRVQDVGATVQRAERLGATVQIPPAAGQANRDIALIIDPTGASLALINWDYEDGQ